MVRRLIATIAALATALSVAGAPQAHAQGAGGTMAWDLCVGGAPVPAAPDRSAPSHAHADCDRCCGSTASAPPLALATHALRPAGVDAARVAPLPPAPRERAHAPPARAPPRA